MNVCKFRCRHGVECCRRTDSHTQECHELLIHVHIVHRPLSIEMANLGVATCELTSYWHQLTNESNLPNPTKGGDPLIASSDSAN